MNISVVIPTYNRKAKVCCAIDSVLAQTYSANEVIVVDDGSTDGTFEEICARYRDRIDVIRVKNSGAAAARNVGIAKARSEWIALLDSDDVWLPQKLQVQIDILKRYSDTSRFCFSDCYFMGSETRYRSVYEQCGFVADLGGGILRDLRGKILLGAEPFYTPSIIVSRGLILEVGGFDANMLLGEDTDLFFRIGLHTEACYSSEALVAIDRTPNREIGLCNLYSSRDDRVYGSIRRMYEKWLAIPSIQGSELERPIRRLLRDTLYSALASKITQRRWSAAMAEARDLMAMDRGAVAVLGGLILRKAKKLIRRNTGPVL